MPMPSEAFEGYPLVTSGDIPLPRKAKVGIPRLAIALTNRSIKGAHPMLYGREVPVLREQDVRVVTAQSMSSFSQEVAGRIFHSETLAYDEARAQELGSNGIHSVEASFMTMVDYPGRPILVLDSYVEELIPYGEVILSEILATMFIHEHFHRIPVTRDLLLHQGDHLFKQIAFSGQIAQLNLMPDGATKDALHRHLERFMDRVGSRPAMLRFLGGLASVYALDELDGKFRRVVDNGYDTNEGLIELLAEAPRVQLMQEVVKNHTTADAASINSAIAEAQGIDSSVYIQQYTPDQIKEYCMGLGLSSNALILGAYRESRFAQLHSELMPGVLYRT